MAFEILLLLCSQLTFSRKYPEYLDIPALSTVHQEHWEECIISASCDQISSVLKEMISIVSHGHAAQGLHDLAQHAIGDLRSHPRGSFSYRPYTSVRFQPLCSEDSEKLTAEISVPLHVIGLVASRDSTCSSSSIASKARPYEARRPISLFAKS
jgi:hypothetical protein